VIDAEERAPEVECGHDGYTRLTGRPLHRRKLKLLPDGLEVADSVTGGGHSAEARFHVHPDWVVSAAADGAQGIILSPEGRKIDWQVEAGHGRLQASSFHPEFGISIPSSCLAVDLAKGRSFVRFRW
jgi:uncharacterized heparinase superfamily protein